jgi:hypothetical protein
MKLSFSYNEITESERLLDTLAMVSEGFYTKNGFYVLPQLQPEYKNKPVIVVPQLHYFSYEKSWKGFDNKKFTTKLALQLSTSGYFTPLSEKEFQNFQKNAIKVLQPVLGKSEVVFPYLKDIDVTIAVHPTFFGSSGSFKVHDFTKKTETAVTLDIYLRIDQSFDNLIELFSSAITRGLLKTPYTWRDSEAISDFFTKYIFNYPKPYFGTLERLENIDEELLRQSISYLIELNAPLGTPLFFKEDVNRIFLVNKDISAEFSPYEFRFLKTLISHANDSVTFDNLADQMYHTKADVKYSLWGITKTAQRVRDKFEEMGLPRDIICNVKGEGFMLRN